MINLLPPAYKKELHREEQFRLVLVLGMLLVIFLICLSLSLLAIRVYIAGEIEAEQILVESQREEKDELRSEHIRKLNGDIAAISSFYERKIWVSDLIEQISQALPQAISLSSLTYTPGSPKAKVVLKGFAPRTEDLLELQANLEANPSVSNVIIPPSNWARSTNIDFSLDFEI